MFVDAAKFLTFLLLHQSCWKWLKVWNQLQNISQSIFWGTRYIKLIHSNTVIYVLLPTFFWEEAFPFFLSYLTGNYMYLLPSYICTYRYVRFIIKFFVCWTLVEHVIIFSEPLKIIFIFQCNILTGVESGAVTYLLIVI